MKLISETIDEPLKLLEEDANGKRVFFVEGPAAVAEVGNKNKRRYPADVLGREIDRYVNECVKTGSALGELGHPQGPTINLERVSHLFKKVIREGNVWRARAQILETDFGNNARKIIEAGGRIGFSTRGMGSLKPLSDGIMEVQDDYRLCTLADLVAEPSAPDAWVAGIMEGVDWYCDQSTGTWVRESVDRTRSQIKKMSLTELSEQKVAMFSTFLDNLVKKS